MADMGWDEFVAEAGDKFDVPPEGDYEFTIEDAEATVAKSSGNPMIKAKLKIAEGPQAGKSIKAVNVVKSPKAASMFLRHVNAVGISADTLREQKPTLAQIASVMVGKRVSGKVKRGEYMGMPQAELEWNMKPPTAGAVAVSSFPVLSESESLGYDTPGSGTTVPTTDDAGF